MLVNDGCAISSSFIQVGSDLPEYPTQTTHDLFQQRREAGESIIPRRRYSQKILSVRKVGSFVLGEAGCVFNPILEVHHIGPSRLIARENPASSVHECVCTVSAIYYLQCRTPFAEIERVTALTVA